MYLKNRL